MMEADNLDVIIKGGVYCALCHARVVNKDYCVVYKDGRIVHSGCSRVSDSKAYKILENKADSLDYKIVELKTSRIWAWLVASIFFILWLLTGVMMAKCCLNEEVK